MSGERGTVHASLAKAGSLTWMVSSDARSRRLIRRRAPERTAFLAFSAIGYRLSERQGDYVEWEGPCGWFILRPARTGSKDRPHDRYEPSTTWLSALRPGNRLTRSIGISCCPCAPRCSTRRRSGRNTAKATTLCSSSIPTASSSSSHTRPRKAGPNDRWQPAWPLAFGFTQNGPSRPRSSSTLASGPRCAVLSNDTPRPALPICRRLLFAARVLHRVPGGRHRACAASRVAGWTSPLICAVQI